MAHDRCNFYFSFWAIFYPFKLDPPPLIAKTIPRNMIILQWCTKNYDQMMYGSCDMVYDGQTDGQTKK